MTVSNARGDKKKCDDLFRKIIRSKGQCEACGSSGYVETSHIVGRTYSHTRTYELNAHALCRACHRKWHKNGAWAAGFLWQTRTTAEVDELEERSRRREKFDWSAELERLRQVAAEMEVQ
jgi:5-methylcytosine-specific restriction endonuclease McrA